MTEDEMAEWHHQLDGHEFEQAPGIGDGQESLACCSPWGWRSLADYSLLGLKRVRYDSATKEKAMATHSSTLAWTIPGTEEPGRLQSMGSLRVRDD